MDEPSTASVASEPPTADLAARVAVAPLLTLDGDETQLRDAWRAGPTVTVFIRHFGCLFCHQMVHDVLQRVPDVLGAGGRVVLVGNGTPEQAAGFARRKGLPREGVAVLTDPGREAFRAAALDRGFMKTFGNASSWRAYGRARKDGHRITGSFGDVMQLGGVMVVRPPARIDYLHRSKFAGDHPNLGEVLSALRQGRTEPPPP